MHGDRDRCVPGGRVATIAPWLSQRLAGQSDSDKKTAAAFLDALAGE